ncbi:MAG: putative chaperone, magnesium chelatase family protein [Parcubacteria group bacterium]|nr:putative chaperone, magnesium chelatase family protein [Parcubacteria group bacterium]
MFSRVYSAQTNLLSVHAVSVETDISRGLYAFAVVGLPDKAVEEARDRVSAAIKNSGLTSPKSKNQKIVISLAPASEKKEGPAFDLAIALSYLLASEEIAFDPEEKLFLGELSLDGKLRSIRGTLPVARFAKANGFKELFVPKDNAEEAALIEGVSVFGVESLEEVILHLEGKASIRPTPLTRLMQNERTSSTDFADVRGQERAKRGLLIAAAGGHNVAMYGPPGTGKTMLAKAFTGILPPLSFDEALEATSIHSVAGILGTTSGFITDPPFRSPHHTSSYVSLVGGGVTPKPGEVTLAHRGVLFMDEFPEFERRVIESLRQPLEDRVISVSRAKGTAHFPADVLLVAAMNPCPCGNYGFRGKPCICTPAALSRYRRKMSGPIIDRIDIWLEVDRVLPTDLSGGPEGEKSEFYKNKVESARKIQAERFKTNTKLRKNAEMGSRDLVTHVALDDGAKRALNLAAERLGFSPRVYHRMIKVARTIADLEGAQDVSQNHILEAVEYRPKKFDA